MKLKELQEQFANHIENPKQTKIFGEILKQNITAVDSLQIYRNNVFGGFDAVLEMIYPTIKNLVGKNCFANFCTKYRQKYISESGNLNDYGKHFAKLVSDLKTEHQLAYLKDLAKLEWQFHRAYFSKETADFEIKKFKKLKEKDLFKVKFKLHPSCCLLASKYQIYNIWNFFKTNSKKKVDLKKLENQWVLISRPKYKTNLEELSKLEFLFLKQVKSKKNLYQIYQILIKLQPNFDIGSLINKYISTGIISAYEL
jgi:hypothetical protein